SVTDLQTYFCIAKNRSGADTSYACELASACRIPATLINNKKIIRPTILKKDSTVTMRAEAVGSPTLSFVWFKNGSILSVPNQSQLLTQRFDFIDEGAYTCIVRNNWGADTTRPDTLVRSNSSPVWKSEEMACTVKEGDTMALALTTICSDADRDTLHFSIIMAKPGKDTLLQNGIYQYTPDFKGSKLHTPRIVVSDTRLSDTVTLRISITAVNRAPAFIDTLPKNSYAITPGERLCIQFKAIDPDGDFLLYLLGECDLPQRSGFQHELIFNDSQLIWQSIITDTGRYSAMLKVTDRIDTVMKRVTIGVGNTNLAPQLFIKAQVNDLPQDVTRPVQVKEMRTLTCSVRVLDPNTSDQTYLRQAKNLPAGATYDTTRGVFTYQPPLSLTDGLHPTTLPPLWFFGCDQNGATDSLSLTIVAIDSNSAPVWKMPSATIASRELSTMQYAIADAFGGDNEGDSVKFMSSLGFFDSASASVVWQPGPLDAGKRTCIISATDNHVPSASSDFSLSITVQDSVVPSTLFKPDNITTSGLRILWSKSNEPQFKEYRLYYATTPAVTQSSACAVVAISPVDTAATVTGLSPDTRYYFRVYTCNSSPTSAGSNEVDAKTIGTEPPQLIITTPLLTRDSGFTGRNFGTVSGIVRSKSVVDTITAIVNSNPLKVVRTDSTWQASLANAAVIGWNVITLQATDSSGRFTEKTIWIYLIEYRPIAAGEDHTLLVKSNGVVGGCGDNHDGELGVGDTVIRRSPVQITQGVTAVAAGINHSLFLKSDGTLWGCGDNEYGELGLGDTIDRSVAVCISGNVVAVAAGVNYSMILKSDGSLWTCGVNDSGQLGTGDIVRRTVFGKIMTGVKTMAAGFSHWLAIRNDGSLWTCGSNKYNQLGVENTELQTSAIQVTTGVTAVSAGWAHSLILKSDGSLWVCGCGEDGQLGINSSVSKSPLRVNEFISTVSQIAAGGYHSLALKSDGTLWSWGYAEFGALGIGDVGKNIKKSPVQITTMSAVSAITAGCDHTIILKIDGTFWGCGYNLNGQLGDGTSTNRNVPCQIPF
ncbi:MAG: fibronectin type III domain-containing protein, partial [Chitinivibrionales bacterium]|nr:fibronectin type III domain-containing protein [Chitinivibrionales bacterium]